MADNDKLEINFRDLAKNASQYVFSSTFPSLERMLKTVQSVNEENRAQVENLSSSIESVNVKLNEVNSGLRRLNDAMSKSLGILGKILRKEESGSSSGGGGLLGGGLNVLSGAAGAAGGLSAMMQIVENNKTTAPGPETQTTDTSESTKKTTEDPNKKDATKAASPAGATQTAAPKPEKKEASAESNSKTLLIKASTITFDAGQIIFTSGGGASSGSSSSAAAASPAAPAGGQGQSATPVSQGGQQNLPPEQEQQQQSGGAGGGASGTPGSYEASVVKSSGGMTRLRTRSKREYEVATPEAKNFFGFVDELERSGYKINQIGGFRQSAMWHGKGMAIDINPDQNPMLENKNGRIINRITGQESSGLKNPKYPFGYGKDNFGSIDVSGMAKRHNLGWGGNWRSSTDSMHFSAGPNEKTEPTPQAVAARGGGGAGTGEQQVASSAPSATPVQKPAPTSSGSSGGPSAPLGATPADKKTPPAASPMPVAADNTKGSELNRESTSSEVASITPPERASMSSLKMGGGQQKESDIPKNPKIADANRAGNVEPEDAEQRYKSLFGMESRVPTGSSARV